MSAPTFELVPAWTQIAGPHADEAWKLLEPILRREARRAARSRAEGRDASFADDLFARCCARLLDRAGRDPLPALEHDRAIVTYLRRMLTRDASNIVGRTRAAAPLIEEDDDTVGGHREVADLHPDDHRWADTPADVALEHAEDLRAAGLEDTDVLRALEVALNAVADAVAGTDQHRERRLRAVRQIVLLDVHDATLDDALRATGELTADMPPSEVGRARASAYQAHHRVRLKVVELCEANLVPPAHAALLRAWAVSTDRRGRPGAKR